MSEAEKLGGVYLLRLLRPIFLPYFAVCVLFFLALSLLGLIYLRYLGNAVEQEMVWDVPEVVAQGLPSLSVLRGSSAVPEILQDLSLINPELEFYVLNAEGTVVFPKPLSGTQVSLAPIERILQPEVPLPPVFGDDPRVPGRQSLFAAAPLVNTDDGEQGFVYLLIRSRLLTALGTLGGSAKLFGMLFLRFIPFLIFCVALGLGFTFSTTQSFRRILSLIRAYSSGNLSAEWRSRSTDDIDDLGRSIQSVAREVLSEEQAAKNREELRRGLLLEVVHDVRSPLMGIRAAIEIMIREALLLGKGVSSELATTLEAGTTSMVNLSNSLQHAADLDPSEEGIHLVRLDPVGVVERVVAQVHTAIESRGLHLRVVHAEPIPEISADPAALERVLLNLLDNAARHTLSGGEIFISVTANEVQVEISVRDNGVGISPEELPFIFERFFRGSAQNLAQGAGVGLAIVKKLVTLHGGTISAASQLNEGSNFLITLPARRIPSAEIDLHNARTTFSFEDESVIPQLEKKSFRGLLLFQAVVALVILFFLPRMTTPGTLFFYGTVSAWIGYASMARRSGNSSLLVILPFAFLYGWWWYVAERPALSLIAIVICFFLGSGFVSHVRSPEGKRSFLRLFYLSNMLNVVAIGWAVHILHTTAEEELSRFAKGSEPQFAERVAHKLSSLWCAEHGEQPGEDEFKVEGFVKFQALNLKSELSLSGPDALRIGKIPDSLDDFSPTADNLYPSLLRKLSVPRRHLSVKKELPGCGSSLTLTTGFISGLFRLVMKSTANQYDLGFAGAAAILAAFLFFFVCRRSSWPHDELLQEIKDLIGKYLREKDLNPVIAPRSTLSRPIVEAVSRLITECEVSRQRAESSDRDIRSLALLAAGEYGHFARMLQPLVSELRLQAAAFDQAGPEPLQNSIEIVLRKLENIVEAEIGLTRAVFELTRLTNEKSDEELAMVRLSELLESVVLDQLGILDAYSVIVRPIVPEEFQIESDPRMLRFVFSSLLHGLARMVPAGTEFTVSAGIEDGKAFVRLRPENAAVPVGLNRVNAEPLGVFVARELCKRMNIEAVFQQDLSLHFTGRSSKHFGDSL